MLYGRKDKCSAMSIVAQWQTWQLLFNINHCEMKFWWNMWPHLSWSSLSPNWKSSSQIGQVEVLLLLSLICSPEIVISMFSPTFSLNNEPYIVNISEKYFHRSTNYVILRYNSTLISMGIAWQISLNSVINSYILLCSKKVWPSESGPGDHSSNSQKFLIVSYILPNTRHPLFANSICAPHDLSINNRCCSTSSSNLRWVTQKCWSRSSWSGL